MGSSFDDVLVLMKAGTGFTAIYGGQTAGDKIVHYVRNRLS